MNRSRTMREMACVLVGALALVPANGFAQSVVGPYRFSGAAAYADTQSLGCNGGSAYPSGPADCAGMVTGYSPATCIANMSCTESSAVELGFIDVPITNHVGPDVVVFDSVFSNDAYAVSVELSPGVYSPFLPFLVATQTNTGVVGCAGSSTLWGVNIDLTRFGLPLGAVVNRIRVTSFSSTSGCQADLTMAAVLDTIICLGSADCNDGNVCTTDTCAAAACVYTPSGAAGCLPACAGTAPAAAAVDEGGATTLALSGVTAGATVTWDLDNNGSYETPGPTAIFSAVGRDGASGATVGYSIAGASCANTTGTMRVTINNVAPSVNSIAPTSGSPGVVVSYTATATDPAGAADPLTWSLVSGPSGAAITPGGAFTWTPGAGDVGSTRTVVIEVSDGDGGVTRQTFMIRVVECVMPSQCDDGIACTVDACGLTNACTHVALPAGTVGTCTGAAVCSGAPSNTCVQCVTNAQCGGTSPLCDVTTNRCVQCLSGTDCGDSNACTSDVCTSNVCSNPVLPAGTTCATGVCDGSAAALCVACVDNAMGTMTDTGCGDGAPICDVGGAGGPVCVACLSATDCADTNVCTTEACVSNACVITPVDAGETGMCADALVCSGPAGTTPNSCVQCTSNDQCADPTAFCDTVANTCGPCTADFSGTGAACPEANPFCAFTGPTMGVCGRCTTNADCEGHTGGPLCDLVSGGCGTACNVDADCADGEWCPDSRVCAPQVPNGMSVPAAGPASGMCTETIGTRTCISGVCFEDDDLCGLPTGETCTDEGVCRSAICASNGLCGDCDSNDDCMGGRVCVVSTGTCVMPDGGMPDAGPGDAGPRDAGASTFDAGDAGPTPGGLAGGSCGCAVNTTQGNSGILAMLGMLALVVARKRRQR